MKRDKLYEDILRPLLFTLEPEDAHELVHGMMRRFGGMLATFPYRYTGTDLRTNVAGTVFDNPVGLAAGFDKNADLIGVLRHVGFGFAEVGSITARASQGNPRPRLFRLAEDQALINRLGLNGEGAAAVAKRLSSIHASLPIAVNIAKTHDPAIAGDAAVEDILTSFRAIKHLDLSYVALNVSCPNTREGCMKERQELSIILSEMQKLNERGLPLFVKISPDSSDELIYDVVQVATECRLSGYICGNTTVTRDGLTTHANKLAEIGAGGLSGPPLTKLALSTCKKIAGLKAPAQNVIAVGGIRSGADAYRFIRAGASAIELYTGLIFVGPSLPKLICDELSELLRHDGITLEQAIGADLK